jgi:hypothetical protein
MGALGEIPSGQALPEVNLEAVLRMTMDSEYS